MDNDLAIVVKTILEVDEAESKQRIDQARDRIIGKNSTVKFDADINRKVFQDNVKDAIASVEKNVAKTPFKFGADVKRQELQDNLKAAVKSAKKTLGDTPIKIAIGVDHKASMKQIDSFIEAARKKIADVKLDLNINSNLVSGGSKTGSSKSKSTWKSNPQNIEGGKRYREALEESIRANEHIFKSKNMSRSSTSYFISPSDNQVKAIVEYSDGLGKTASMMFTAQKAAKGSEKLLEHIQVKQLKVVDSQEKYNIAISKQNKALEASKNWLSQQENAFSNLYSKAFNQKNPLTDNFRAEAEEALAEYSSAIEKLKLAGGKIGGNQKREVSGLQEYAKRIIDEQRSSQYGQADLGAKDISSQRKIREIEIDNEIKNLQKLGLYTGDVENKFGKLKATISTIDDFNVLQEWQEGFRVAKKEADSLLSSVQGLGAKQAIGIGDKQITQIDSMLGIEKIQTGTTSGLLGLREELQGLKNKYAELQNVFRSTDLNEQQYASATEQLKRLDIQLRTVANSAKIFNGSSKSSEALARLGASKEKLASDFANMKFNWSKALEIPELKKQIDEVERAIHDVDEINIRSVQNQFKQLQANIKLAKADAKSFTTQIKELFAEFYKYFSVADIIREAAQAISLMSDNVKTLNTAMTELKKVTDLTEHGYDKFLVNAGNRAIDIGTSISELVNSTADASRLGFGMSDANSIADASNIYMKVGDDIESIDDATQSIISTMQAFNVEAEDAIEIVDKFNAAGNNLAISSGGIGTALQKSASALAEANNTLDESIALIAASNRVAQDPSSVGQMWKTVSMRLRGAKAELEAAGEDTEGMVESTAQLQELVKGITGFDILEADQKTFKSTYDIVVGIAKEWGNISDIEQASLLEKLAGKRQGNYFAAALSNMADLNKSMEITENSAGSAMTEHERWMQSIAAAEARASAAFEQFSSKVLSSDLIKMGYDAQTGILGFLSNVIDLSGSAIPLVTSLTSGLLSLTHGIGIFSNIKHKDGTQVGLLDSIGLFGRSFSQIGQNRIDNKFVKQFNGFLSQGFSNADALEKAKANVSGISKEIIAAAEASDGAGIKFQALGLKAKAASIGLNLLATAGNMVAVALVTFIATKVVEGIDNWIHRVDIMREKIEDIGTRFNDTVSEIQEVQDELAKVQDTIKELESKGAILTLAESGELDELREYNKELQLRNRLLEHQKQTQAKELKGASIDLFYSQYSNTYNKDLQGNLDQYTSGLKTGMNNIVGLTVGGLQEGKYDYAALIAAYKYNEELKRVTDSSYEEYQAIDEINTEIAKVLNKQLSEATEIRSTLKNLPRDDQTSEVKDAIKWIDQFEQMYWNAVDPQFWMESQFDSIFGDSKFDSITSKLIEMSEQGQLTKEAFDSLANDVTFKALSEEFAKVGIYMDNVFAEIANRYPETKAPTTNIPLFGTKSASKFAGGEKYNTLLDAIEAQNEAGTISVELYNEIIEIDEKLAEMLEATADGYILNTEAMYEYIEAQDKMIRLDAIGAISDLQKQLENADLDVAEQDSIKKQISEWELLIYEIENATGALAKWKIANSTANQDAAFGEGESMYEVLKEGNKTGKTGTDDFQSAVDFMLGEGWESRIGTDFKDLYDAYAQAEKNAKKYFGQSDERTGMKNFASELVENKFASWGKDAQGNKVLSLAEGLNIEDVAAELKMSEDAVKSLFKLMEAYGANFDWGFFISEEDKENLKDYEERVKVIADAQNVLSEKEIELGGLDEGSEEYNSKLDEINEIKSAIDVLKQDLEESVSETEGAVNTTLTLEEALLKITELQEAISVLANSGIDVPVTLTGQYDALRDIIDTILGGTETEDGGYTFTVDGIDDAKSKLSDIRGVMTWLKLNPDIAATLNEKFIDDLENAESTLQEIVDSEENGDRTVTITLSPDDNVTPAIEGATGSTDANGNPRTATIDINPNDNVTSAINSVTGSTDANGKPRTATINIKPNDTASAKIQEIIKGDKDSGSYDVLINYNDEESYSTVLAHLETLTTEREVKIKINAENEEEAVEDILAKLNNDGKPAVAMPGGEEGTYTLHSVDEVVADVLSKLTVGYGANFEEIHDEILSIFYEDYVSKGMEVYTKDATGKIDESAAIDDTWTIFGKRFIESAKALESESALASQAIENAAENIGDISNTDVEPETNTEPKQEAFQAHRAEVEQVFGEEVDIPIGADLEAANSAYLAYRDKVTKQLIIPIGISGGGAGKNLNATFATGTDGAPGGLSLVDDGRGANAGAELIEHTSRGTFELGSGDGPRLTMLDKGDVVHTAKETKSILKRLAKVGGFFRNGLNKGKSIIGKAFATGVSGSMVWTDAIQAISKTSSSSKSKAKKTSSWKTYVEKLFDWIEIRLERLQTATDKWILSATNAIGYAAKNANLDKALENTRLQVQETTAAYERYLKQANTVQKKTGLSNATVKKIQEGTIDISSYSDTTQEKIKAYQEWYEKAMGCVDALTELKEQERELAQEKLDNILNHYQWRIDRLDAVIDKMHETIDLKAVTGVEVVEGDYEKALEATREKIEELNESREVLAAEFKGLMDDGYIQEGSEEWNNYTSELEDLDQTIIETKINLQDLKDAVDQIALTNLDYAISGLEGYADAIQGMMSLHDSQGSDHKDTDYEALIRNGMEQIQNLERQNDILKDQQKNLDRNSEKYQEIQEQITDNNNAILDMKVSQEEWNDAVIDLKIQELQKYQEELQKINDKYQDQKNLQKAIEDLERARTQRTQRVYREGLGFVYEADQDELKSAQENLESVVHDQLLGKIDELIDALDDSKADTNVYDAAGNLIGTQYVLPEIENLSALLGGSSTDGTLSGLVTDAKKAIYSQIFGNNGQSVSVHMGNIVLEGVNDPNALADAIVDQFSNAVTQAIYTKL